MIFWTDLFSSAKLGDIQLLADDEVDASKHLLLTTSSATVLSTAVWPDLAASGLLPLNRWEWDGTADRSNGGYYLAATGGGELGVFETTPGRGEGPLRAIGYGGIWESNDRGATWVWTPKSGGWLIPQPWSPSAVPASIMQDTNGDLYHSWTYNDYDGDGFNHKAVCRSTDFGNTWQQLWAPEASDGSSNQLIDVAIGVVAGTKRLVSIQYNGRIITSDFNGVSWSNYTQRRGGSGGSAPFCFAVRWIQEFNNGAGLFVIVGGDRIHTSPDGITWTQVMLPAGTSAHSLTSYGPLGVLAFTRNSSAVGTSGNQKPVRSTDGVTWTAQPLNIPYSNFNNPQSASTLACVAVGPDKSAYYVSFKHPNTANNPQFGVTSDFVNWDSFEINTVNQNHNVIKVFADIVMLSPAYSMNSYNNNSASYQMGRLKRKDSPTMTLPRLIMSNPPTPSTTKKYYLRAAN